MQINEVNAWVTRALLEYPFKVNTDLPASQYLLQFTKVSESGHAKENDDDDYDDDDDDDLMIDDLIDDQGWGWGWWLLELLICFIILFSWMKFVNFKWYLIEIQS